MILDGSIVDVRNAREFRRRLGVVEGTPDGIGTPGRPGAPGDPGAPGTPGVGWSPTAGTVAYAATVAVDLDGDQYQSITLAGDLEFTGTTNRGPAKQAVVRLIGDGSLRTLTFPASWVFFGFKPTRLMANKEGVLSLACLGTAETDVRAAYMPQR